MTVGKSWTRVWRPVEETSQVPSISNQGLIILFGHAEPSVSRRIHPRAVIKRLACVTCGRARSSSRRAFVIGDLNAEPDEATIATLQGEGSLDAWESADGPHPQGGSRLAIAPSRRLFSLFFQPAREVAWLDL